MNVSALRQRSYDAKRAVVLEALRSRRRHDAVLCVKFTKIISGVWDSLYASLKLRGLGHL